LAQLEKASPFLRIKKVVDGEAEFEGSVVRRCGIRKRQIGIYPFSNIGSGAKIK
jgi:hypothetical protein